MDIDFSIEVFEVWYKDNKFNSFLLPAYGEWVYILDKFWTIERCRFIYEHGEPIPITHRANNMNIIAWSPYEEYLKEAMQILIRGGSIWLK